KTYLGLAPVECGGAFWRVESDAKFVDLVDRLGGMFPDRNDKLQISAMRHYHRLRNQVYHHGNGINPDRRQVVGYSEAAERLLHALFGEQPSSDDDAVPGPIVAQSVSHQPSLAE